MEKKDFIKIANEIIADTCKGIDLNENKPLYGAISGERLSLSNKVDILWNADECILYLPYYWTYKTRTATIINIYHKIVHIEPQGDYHKDFIKNDFCISITNWTYGNNASADLRMAVYKIESFSVDINPEEGVHNIWHSYLLIKKCSDIIKKECENDIYKLQMKVEKLNKKLNDLERHDNHEMDNLEKEIGYSAMHVVTTNNPQPSTIDVFDWDAFENGAVANISREELNRSYDLNIVADHQIADGKIVSIGKNEVVVDIGYIVNCNISISEFNYNPDLKVGDTVEVYVEHVDMKNNKLMLSHKKAYLANAKFRIDQAFEKKEMVSCYVVKHSDEGLIVDISGFEAILPYSLLEIANEKHSNNLIGKVIEVYIIKVYKKTSVIIVSQKPFDDDVALSIWGVLEDEDMYEDDNNKDDDSHDDFEIQPDISEMVCTHGTMWPCPHCGSRDVQTYIDGTAKCRNCGGWYYYA